MKLLTINEESSLKTIIKWTHGMYHCQDKPSLHILRRTQQVAHYTCSTIRELILRWLGCICYEGENIGELIPDSAVYKFWGNIQPCPISLPIRS